MRIAICFSGQLRTWKKVYNTWDYIVNNKNNEHQIDYFFHTFYENSTPKIGVSHVNMDLVDIPESDFDEICEIFKPKKSKIESQKAFVDLLNIDQYVNPYVCQYYSMYKSCELKKEYEIENNFEYDLVIKMRYDLFFKHFIIDEDNIISENTYYGYNPDYDEMGNLRRITDLFFYSKSKTFDFLSTYYINTELLPIEYRDHSIEPEFAWFYNITSNNIKIEEYHWDIKVMRNDLSEIKNNDFSYEIY
jgi:hypothetical protein